MSKRKAVTQLAHQHPELRKHLIPLLRKTSSEKSISEHLETISKDAHHRLGVNIGSSEIAALERGITRGGMVRTEIPIPHIPVPLNLAFSSFLVQFKTEVMDESQWAVEVSLGYAGKHIRFTTVLMGRYEYFDGSMHWTDRFGSETL